jgi:hypothetical protein
MEHCFHIKHLQHVSTAAAIVRNNYFLKELHILSDISVHMRILLRWIVKRYFLNGGIIFVTLTIDPNGWIF